MYSATKALFVHLILIERRGKATFHGIIVHEKHVVKTRALGTLTFEEAGS